MISLEPITLFQVEQDPLRAKHEAWLFEAAMKRWQYGETLDVINKRHPQIMPFDELMAKFRQEVATKS